MSNTIRLKRGTTEPTSGVLVTGEIAINTTDGKAYTLTGAGDVVQIGSSSVSLEATVRNETGSTLTKGQVVYLSGASGNKPLAVLAQANAESTSSGTYGLVKADIATNNNGTVVIGGLINKLNTDGYTDGDKVYLSPTVAGGWTTTKPSAPNHMVFIGTITYAHQNQGAIQLRIANGFEIEELHNVSITSVADKDIISYDSASGLYKNQTATALGLAPIASPTFTGNVTAGTNLISANSSGDEGGEILLAKPQTNTTLSGTGVTIDVYQNKLRIFEQGGSARGAYIDLTAAGAGVATNLLSGGATSASWGSITGTLSSQTDLNTALGLKAPLASPALTGNVTITTNSTSPALSIVQDGTGDIVQFKDVTSDTTYSFIDQNGKVNTIASTTTNAGFSIPHGTAPSSPVNGDVWSTSSGLFARINSATQQFAPLASPAFSGTPSLPTGTTGVTQTAGNSTTALATTAFVTTADNLKANLASPSFTGTPLAPTPATSTNTTQIATTAYVKSNLASYATTSYLTTALASYTPTASLNNYSIPTNVSTIWTDYYVYSANSQNSIILINNEGATSHNIYFNGDIDDGYMPVGTQVVFIQQDAYPAVFSAVPYQGVNLYSRGSRYTMNGQYAVATAIKIAANTWVLSGDLV